MHSVFHETRRLHRATPDRRWRLPEFRPYSDGLGMPGNRTTQGQRLEFHVFDRRDLIAGRAETLLGAAGRQQIDMLGQLDLMVVSNWRGVLFCGGLFRGASVTGTGTTRASTLARLRGEVAEVTALAADLPHAACELVTGVSVPVPVCDGPRSEGCAAHPTSGCARLNGLLELIERDALALWWLGGRKGKLMDISDDQTIFIDISAELPGAAVAAVGFCQEEPQFACGTAAASDVATAGRRALRELRQMQIGLALIEWKRKALGQDSLSIQDTIQVQRAHAITREAVLAQTVDPVGAKPTPTTIGQDPACWARSLRDAGFEVLDLALGKHLGLFVHKIVAPKLQSSAPDRRTLRLQRAQEINGGPPEVFAGIPML